MTDFCVSLNSRLERNKEEKKRTRFPARHSDCHTFAQQMQVDAEMRVGCARSPASHRDSHPHAPETAARFTESAARLGCARAPACNRDGCAFLRHRDVTETMGVHAHPHAAATLTRTPQRRARETLNRM